MTTKNGTEEVTRTALFTSCLLSEQRSEIGCSSCTFLGSWREYDLYLCSRANASDAQLVTTTFNDESGYYDYSSEYTFSLNSPVEPALARANLRLPQLIAVGVGFALTRGLVDVRNINEECMELFKTMPTGELI